MYSTVFVYSNYTLEIPSWEIFLGKVWSQLKRFMLQISSFHQTELEMHQEVKIIELCKENPNYFGPIYQKYFEQIYKFVYRRVNDYETADDVTSLVFIKALGNIHKYEFKGVPFSSWLYRIASNEINQYFRNKQKEERIVTFHTESVPDIMTELEFDEPVDDPVEAIAAVFERLESEDVEILELRFFENRSFKEIGEILGISDGNAKIKTYRVLKKAKGILIQNIKGKK